MRYDVQMLLLAPCLLILSNCASLTSSPATSGMVWGSGPQSSFCDVAKPIVYSRTKDTEQTILAVKQHNAKGVELCGWKG